MYPRDLKQFLGFRTFSKKKSTKPLVNFNPIYLTLVAGDPVADSTMLPCYFYTAALIRVNESTVYTVGSTERKQELFPR